MDQETIAVQHLDLQNTLCNKCGLCNTRQQVVNGVGPMNARIVIVGEGPGKMENKLGMPFMGPAGEELNKLLRAAGINRADVYITNVVRCWPINPPDETREPTDEEIAACVPYLEQELNFIKPVLIVPLGNTALRAVTGDKKLTISSVHGHEMWSEKYNCKVMPTFHPAFLLRMAKYEGITIEDFKKIKISSESKEMIKKNPGQYITLDTIEKVQTLVERLANVDAFAFDIETTGFTWKKLKIQEADKVLCVAFTWKVGTGCVVPLVRWQGRDETYTVIQKKKVRRKNKVTGQWDITETEVPVQKVRVVDEYYPYWGDKQDYVLELLRKIFTNDAAKIGHNGKFDIKFLTELLKVDVKNFWFDTMLAHYLLDENAEGMHGLKDCAWAYTDMGGYEAPLDQWFKERHITEEKRNYAHLPPEMLYQYNCMDTDVTFRLFMIFKDMIESEGLSQLMHRLIMPMVATLMKAEIDGVQIDVVYMQKLKTDLEVERVTLNAELINMVGPINFKSPLQLRKLLFETLKLPSFKKTKGTKNPQDSTDEEVLKELAKMHKVPSKILDLRKLEKLLGTYIAGIEEALDDDNRIHTTYLIHGTVTGRLASREPNLQNIPRDDKRIKKLFIARPGWMIVESDYGQAEFRHWANYAQDERMIADIKAATEGTGPDIHKLTASEVLGIPVDAVTTEQRQQAKGVVFGLMYGRGSASLAEEFHISEAEAKRIIQHFFSKYPRAERWLKEAINSVRRHKQIRNVFGRIRRLPGILSSEYLTKAESERQALNSPIQSAASDMNCNAANRVRMKFKTLDFKGVLCLLVHDSLLYEVPIMEVQESLNIIKIEMERPIEGVTVPMQAEFKVGTRWGLLEEFVPKGDEWYQVKKDPTVGKIKTLVDFNKLEELYAR